VRTRKTSILAWSIVMASTALVIAGLVIASFGATFTFADPRASIGVMVFAVVSVLGGLVASRQPRNPIGWFFCGFCAVNAVTVVAVGYAEVAPANATRGVGQAAAWFANWTYVTYFTLVIFALLYFPDGHLLSRRWRLAGWCGAMGTAAFAAGNAFKAGHLDGYPRVDNPVGLDPWLTTALAASGAILTICALAAAAASVVLRYRCSGGLGRQQIKWLALAAVFAFVAVTVGGTLDALVSQNAGDALILLGVLGIPIAIGIAILRHRLYDIDVIIRKTLIYAGLIATLAVVYLAGIFGLGWLFESLTGQSGALAVTLSTLAVAVAFQPLRHHVQRAVDHRFYRTHYDAAQTLEAFSGRLRQEIDLDALHSEVLGVVRDTVQPSQVTLWLRPAEQRRP